MGAQERQLHPDRSPRHFYGSEIRRFRKLHDNMSLARLSKIINFSVSHLSRIEGGESKPPEGLSELLDAAFGTDGHFQRLYMLAKKEPFPDKYGTLLKLAATARAQATYTLSFPGLLQTKAVVLAMLQAGEPFADPVEINDWLTTRLERQERVYRQPAECRYWFIVDEYALVRPIGSPAVMVEQLSKVLEASELRHVTVQVLPLRAGAHSELGGSSLTLLTLDDGSEVAYEEGSRSGKLFEDSQDVQHRQGLYDLLRAQALSPTDSQAKIRSALEGITDAAPRQA
ncbi:helix-turn-helix transcriptional regulator [Kitasatospora sp. NPDC059811]|uniref:helix-turn-helix domain-containing protein n=1 Tax=Kitasatospora sp. NPDC059811 TaxID=3346957 RepID=UPI003649BEFD